jgi:hypothetical protein
MALVDSGKEGGDEEKEFVPESRRRLSVREMLSKNINLI